MAANWDVIKGSWNQLKGEARTQWGQLTDDELDQIAGDREKLIGKVQEQYGWSREEAERDVDAFARRMSPRISP
jgi:uncharacterized protein YjbJ (UPF0337 family)